MRKITKAAIIAASGLAIVGAGSAVYAQVVPHGPSRTDVQDMAARAFDRMDANLDGQIDAADREDRVRARFDAADTDGNGALAYAEFTAMRDDRLERRPMDGGRHGGPDGHGGRKGPGGMGMMGLGLAPAQADTAMTEAQFTAAIMARFDRADANKDGVMTREEVGALRTAIRAENQSQRAKMRATPAPSPSAAPKAAAGES